MHATINWKRYNTNQGKKWYRNNEKHNANSHATKPITAPSAANRIADAPTASHASFTPPLILAFILVLRLTVPEHGCVIWTSLSIFIHHLDSAASGPAKVIICLRGTSTTNPAELIATEDARHVIAASVLFYSSAAHGAEWHVTPVFLDPALKLSLHSLIATDILAVPSIPTLEAYFRAARGTDEPFSFLIWCSNVRCTPWLDTPTNQNIRIERLLFLEACKLWD